MSVVSTPIVISSTPIEYPPELMSDYSVSFTEREYKEHVIYCIDEYIKTNKIMGVKAHVMYILCHLFVSKMEATGKDTFIQQFDTSRRKPYGSSIVKIGDTEYIVWENRQVSYSIYGQEIPGYNIFLWNGESDVYKVLYNLFI